MKVLLPEAIISLCCHRLAMTYNQADVFLSSGCER